MANSVDPDQMPQNAMSDQGLHYLQKRLQNIIMIKLTNTPYNIGNGPVQRFKVEEHSS